MQGESEMGKGWGLWVGGGDDTTEVRRRMGSLRERESSGAGEKSELAPSDQRECGREFPLQAWVISARILTNTNVPMLSHAKMVVNSSRETSTGPQPGPVLDRLQPWQTKPTLMYAEATAPRAAPPHLCGSFTDTREHIHVCAARVELEVSSRA